MNGSPLTPAHGAPVRALAPNAYGMDSVKWLVRIRLLDRPFEGHFQTRDYRLFPADAAAAPAKPIGPVRVNSLVAQPGDGAELHHGEPVRVVGYAWSGSGPIRTVEISSDEGRSWTPARLTGPETPFAWRLWEAEWKPERPGRHALAARAMDATGAAQPDQVEWNAKGYANNRIRWIEVQVR
jgi:DMSO/TMAO reductase YedYZ molybdopterin-dependent catalytic subunit